MVSRARKAGRAPSAPKSAKAPPPAPANPELHAQKRKLLLQHYRTKYGVGRGGRGR